MADYEVLAPGGHENLINNVTDRLDEKAYIDGYYAQLTAGAADNLTARGDGVTASFLYRTTAGSASVPDKGEATVRSIKGRTLAWNQLVKATDFATATRSGVTYTNNGDGSITINGTATGQSFITHNYEVVTNHVYLYRMSPAGGADAAYFGDSGMSIGRDYGNGRIGEFTGTSGEKYLCIYVTTGTTVTNLTFYPQLFDLTRMFGVGNEPSTVAEFEALYPEPYYPYDGGSLLSVQMEGIETVGFNQWDEEWELGDISQNTGQNATASTTIRSKNYIDVFPSTEYYFKSPKNGFRYFYDADKNFIGRTDMSANQTFTTPSNAHFMRFRMWSEYGTTYNHDICINLHWSGYMSGTYEAYWSEQRTIAAISENFPDGMRSAGSVADELTETAAITRVGEVDLGTLDWATYSTPANHIFRTNLTAWEDAPAAVGYAAYPDATCARYEGYRYDLISASTDKKFAFGSEYSRFVIVDTAYTDAAAFKAAMSGVMLHYALATPTTTPIDPPLNLSYRFADFGTERVMVPEGEMSAPPTMDVAYGLNAVDTLRTLPTEYISHDSFTQFRLALGAKLGIFIIETWDETDGRYEYTINDA